MARSRWRAWRWIGAAAWAGAIGVPPRRAAASDACSIAIGPPSVAAEWLAAAREAEVQLANAAASETDCASVSVTVRNDVATILLTTQDGRRAVRDVRLPPELAPTIVALVVTVSAAPPLEEAPGSEQRANLERWPEIEPWERPPPPPEHAEVGVGLRAYGGARLATSGEVGASFGGGPVFVLASRWEAAVHVQWDPGYGVDGPAGRFQHSATSFGAAIGMRWPIGAAVWTIGGLSASAMMTRERGGPELGNVGRSVLEPRFGVFLGARIRLASHFALRAWGGPSLVLSRTREPPFDVSPPAVGFDLLTGVEWEVP